MLQLGGRTPLVAALLWGTIAGELVWRLQVDGAAAVPPEGWRDQPEGPLQSAAFDWGPVRPSAVDFAPAGGVDWRSPARAPVRGAQIEVELQLAEGADATLWLGPPGDPGALGLRVGRAGVGWRAGVVGEAGCSVELPSPADRALVGLSWSEGSAHISLGGAGESAPPLACPAPAPPAGVAIQTSAARAGLRRLMVGGQPVEPEPRPYRLGAWLVGAGVAAAFVLAQLAVGTPAAVVLLSLLPLSLGLPLVAVPPGPLRDLGWSPGLLFAGPTVGALALTLLIHAGRASRDLAGGRDWPWGAPLAATLPLALSFAFTGPQRSMPLDALLGVFGAAGGVVALVGALAVAGHRRPRRAAGLALIPTVVFAIAVGFVFRGSSLPSMAAGAAGLCFGLAAGALARGGGRWWRGAAPLALLGALAVELGVRGASPTPPVSATPVPAAPGGAPGPAGLGPRPEVAAPLGAPTAWVVGDAARRAGEGPGSLSAALGEAWSPRWAGPERAGDPRGLLGGDVGLLVMIIGAPDSHRLAVPARSAAWGLGLGLWRACRAAHSGQLAPVVWPRVEAWLDEAAAVDLPVLLIVEPRQADPSAMGSVVSAAGLSPEALSRGPSRLARPGRAVMVHPVAQLRRGGLALPGGGGWRHTPEGGLRFAAAVQQGLAALGLPGPTQPGLPPPAPPGPRPDPAP